MNRKTELDGIPTNTKGGHFIDKLAYCYNSPSNKVWYRLQTQGDILDFPNGDMDQP